MTRAPTVTPLSRLRDFALALPGAHESLPWGDWTAKVDKKIFAFIGARETAFTLGVKLPASSGAALMLPFVQPTGYGLGKAGWVTATFEANETVPLILLEQWIEESYRAIAPRKLVAELDGAPAPAKPKAKKPSKRRVP